MSSKCWKRSNVSIRDSVDIYLIHSISIQIYNTFACARARALTRPFDGLALNPFSLSHTHHYCVTVNRIENQWVCRWVISKNIFYWKSNITYNSNIYFPLNALSFPVRLSLHLPLQLQWTIIIQNTISFRFHQDISPSLSHSLGLVIHSAIESLMPKLQSIRLPIAMETQRIENKSVDIVAATKKRTHIHYIRLHRSTVVTHSAIKLLSSWSWFSSLFFLLFFVF